MRAFLFALSAAIVSANNGKNGNNGKNAGSNSKNKPMGGRGPHKIKRPGKILTQANVALDGNTCYVDCSDLFGEDACRVFDSANGDMSLGTIMCNASGNPLPLGYKGQGGFECDFGDITDPSSDGDLSTSCGGEGFDIGLLIGRDDCTLVGGSTVSCPSTAECSTCECAECGTGKQCVMANGRFGGPKCLPANANGGGASASN